MNKELFLKIFDLYYQITHRKSDIDNADIEIKLSSIGWYVNVQIYKNGFTKGLRPDVYLTVYEDSSTEEIEELIKELENLL